MKRQTAWNGFYRNYRELKVMEAKAARSPEWACDNATTLRMKELQVRKYCKSLVLEHGWQDAHTAQYFTIRTGA